MLPKKERKLVVLLVRPRQHQLQVWVLHEREKAHGPDDLVNEEEQDGGPPEPQARQSGRLWLRARSSFQSRGEYRILPACHLAREVPSESEFSS